MPIDILMPALSPTMTEGNLAKWLKKEGDKIKPGDVIAEIETDKATMEVEAVDEGVLGKIVVPEGTEGVPVNKLIAVLLEAGESKDAIKLPSGDKPAAASNPASAPPSQPSPSEGEGKGGGKPAASSDAAPQASAGGRTPASPLAKRIAGQEGIDLTAIQGTGPHGRIVKADVLEAKGSGGAAPAKAAYVPVPLPSIGGRVSPESVEIKNSGMRKTIAKRLLESKQLVPHFYLSVDCEIDQLLAARAQLNKSAEDAAGKGGKPAYKISVNDIVIKAVAGALKEVPAANATWTDNAIVQYTNVDVSVAVAMEGGLITPVIRNADLKSLAHISNEMKDLAARARDGKLKPEEYQGGGFSISNLGMFGIKTFSAIINPPQSCILAVGASEERAVVKKGEFKAATIMNVTLSVDHRSVDGAVGATFLAAFKKRIENPVMMLV